MKHDTYGESERRHELRPGSPAEVAASGHASVPRPQSRPDIQGLRALAVTMVILGHAGVPPFRGGFVGVDVFFVVSGLLSRPCSCTRRPRAGLWARGAARTLHELTSQSPRVEVISDVTSHAFSPRECITDPNADLATCTTQEQHKTRLGNQVTRRIVRRLGAEFVDVTGLVCQRHRCPLIVDHVITYRDAAHVSVTWTLVVQRELGRLLHLS